MQSFDFTRHGEREFNRLSHQVQKRITEKLRLFIQSGHPMQHAKPLVNLPPTTHRFRVGKYRILFYIEPGKLIIDGVDTREDAYRRR